MKRTGPLHRMTRLARHGARRLREHQARRRFRALVLERAQGRCERCCARARIEAHHLVPCSQAPGWAGLHDPELNGAGLCRTCHELVHEHAVPDWNYWLREAPR